MATGDRNGDAAVYDALCDDLNPPEAGCSCGWRGNADSADDHGCTLPEPQHDEVQRIPVMFCVCGHAHADHDMLASTSCRAYRCGCPRWGLDDMSGRTIAAPPPEPAVLRIAKALEALAKALPDVKSVGAHRTFGAHFQCETDDAVRALAATIGAAIEVHSYQGSQWLSASLDSAQILISGPHTPIVTTPTLDESAVTAALTQAQEAL